MKKRRVKKKDISLNDISCSKSRIKIGNFYIGGDNPLFLVAGPCVIENEAQCLRIAGIIKELSESEGMPIIFKASYDKANRSSGNSYRGPGLDKGLSVLRKVKSRYKLPILTDVHCKAELNAVSKVADVIQIPAFLSRQTDLIVEAAKTGKVINVKKGQFLAPWDMKNVIEKIKDTGNDKIIITERGASFGYNNLVCDMRSLVIMREMGCPVIFDATHSVQLPGGAGDKSGGDRKYVKYLSRGAVAVGCDGLFLEVHEDPDNALCDGPNSLSIHELRGLIGEIKNIDTVIKTRS